MRDSSVLIIGGDSLIGKQLEIVLNALDIKTWRTSRRQSDEKIGTYFLDLEDVAIEATKLPIASTIILCGGVSGYASCSKDPAMAAQINVVNTLKVASKFLQHKCHIIFLSSVAAIGGRIASMDGEIFFPQTLYGALKRSTELGLESEAEKYNATLSIVRLTKVVSWNTPFINSWLSDSLMGSPIKAFSNRFLSPITIEYVCDALVKLISTQSNGIFHLSGEKAITYLELAEIMKSLHLLGNSFIQTVVDDSNDRRSGFLDSALLSMTEVTTSLDIEPEPLDNVLHHLKMTMMNYNK